MQGFNPFEDRLSRDIRNLLSGSFAEAVESGQSEKLQEVIDAYRQQPLDDCYRSYIEDREQRYQKALQHINEDMADAPILQAMVLWNLGLFFEVHEVLEHVWYTAEGEMKATLQALIRAAGAYIKLEYRFSGPAGRLAAKAIPVLEDNRELLKPYFQVEQLISGLKDLEAPPPLLGTF